MSNKEQRIAQLEQRVKLRKEIIDRLLAVIKYKEQRIEEIADVMKADIEEIQKLNEGLNDKR